MPKDRRYWDSDTFLAWFNKETGKYENCLGVMQSAENGDLEIVTSSFTLVEVLYIKGHPKITKEKSNTICRFFERDFIVIVNLDRYIAEDARQLVWDHNVRPQDAVHISTAMKGNINIFDTFDQELLNLNGRLGNPPLGIIKPNIQLQGNLDEYKETRKD